MVHFLCYCLKTEPKNAQISYNPTVCLFKILVSFSQKSDYFERSLGVLVGAPILDSALGPSAIFRSLHFHYKPKLDFQVVREANKIVKNL